MAVSYLVAALTDTCRRPSQVDLSPLLQADHLQGLGEARRGEAGQRMNAVLLLPWPASSTYDKMPQKPKDVCTELQSAYVEAQPKPRANRVVVRQIGRKRSVRGGREPSGERRNRNRNHSYKLPRSSNGNGSVVTSGVRDASHSQPACGGKLHSGAPPTLRRSSEPPVRIERGDKGQVCVGQDYP